MQEHRLTLLEVVAIRRPSPEERRAVWLERKKETNLPARGLAVLGVIACALALVYLNRYELRWRHTFEGATIALAGFLLRGVLTSGHSREDLLDGYEEGVRVGVNRALEITQEDEALIQEAIRTSQRAGGPGEG